MTAALATDFNPLAVPRHNQPPADPFELVKTEINDLYEEARNWADGEPITSQEMHDQIERLYDGLHEAGKRADALRTEEKKPLDDKIAAIQARYADLIADTKSKKGKVTLGKAELAKLLTPWRDAQRIAKEKEAARAAAEAEAARLAAQEAIRASCGNLAAREEAEELLADAKKLERQAGRANKAATVGTGLRTIWKAEIVDFDACLDWWFGEKPEEFRALVQRLADEAVRNGVRKIQGFRVFDTKVAA